MSHSCLKRIQMSNYTKIFSFLGLGHSRFKPDETLERSFELQERLIILVYHVDLIWLGVDIMLGK